MLLATIGSYCTDGEDEMCVLADELADRAGNPKRGFELVMLACERSKSTLACAAVARRYTDGRGTVRAIDKRIELVGPGCAPPTPWAECKVVASYEQAHADDDGRFDPMPIYDGFCATGEREACYLRARRFEADPGRCSARAFLEEVAKSYDQLCAARYGDACARRASLCKRAMDEYTHDRGACGYGIGDGQWSSSAQRNALLALCPRDQWTREVQKRFAADR